MYPRSTLQFQLAQLLTVHGRVAEQPALASGKYFKCTYFTSGHSVNRVALMTGGIAHFVTNSNRERVAKLAH